MCEIIETRMAVEPRVVEKHKSGVCFNVSSICNADLVRGTYFIYTKSSFSQSVGNADVLTSFDRPIIRRIFNLPMDCPNLRFEKQLCTFGRSSSLNKSDFRAALQRRFTLHGALNHEDTYSSVIGRDPVPLNPTPPPLLESRGQTIQFIYRSDRTVYTHRTKITRKT